MPAIQCILVPKILQWIMCFVGLIPGLELKCFCVGTSMKKYALHQTQKTHNVFLEPFSFVYFTSIHLYTNVLQSVAGCVDALDGVVTSGVGDREGGSLGVDRATVFVCLCEGGKEGRGQQLLTTVTNN